MLLGMHTYSLYHHGIGENWAGFKLPWERQMSLFQVMDYVVELGLDGLHMEASALDQNDNDYLEKVKQYAAENNLYLEYNFALKSGNYDSGVQHNIDEGVDIAHRIGAAVAKIGLNLKRPRPIAASEFHPEVMVQLESIVDRVNKVLPFIEKTGVKLALENHTDAFANEILWLLKQINHPQVGACIDTVNALHLTENPVSAVEKLAPKAFTNHFRDNKFVMHPYGLSYVGAAVGEGDLDMVRSYELINQNPDIKMLNIELDLQIPLDDMNEALTIEKEALLRSIDFCRNVLKV